jgi:hypothetical protein
MVLEGNLLPLNVNSRKERYQANNQSFHFIEKRKIREKKISDVKDGKL